MIKRFRILNFKSLADVDVSLEPTTVLIGKSGSGKTNFTEALKCLKSVLLTGNTSHYFNQNGGAAKLLTVTQSGTIFGYEIDFTVKGLSDNLKYKIYFNVTGSNEQRNIGTLKEEALLDGDIEVFRQKDGVVIKKPYDNAPISAGTMALGRITGSSVSSFAHVALTQGISCITIPPTVFRDQIPTEHVEGMNDQATNVQATIKGIVNNLSSLKNWQDIVLALRSLNQSVRSIEVAMPNRDRVLVSHGYNGKLYSFDVKDESEGFRRFAAQMIALYQSPPKQTMCFEEPENGIHPAALEILAGEFKKCPLEGRGQVIITTHSPHFLDYFSPNTIRVVQLENLETRIGPISESQSHSLKNRLLSPGELLTVDPARLEPART